MSTNRIAMKLTDIDLSSLAEVAAAITLLDSVHVRISTGGVPLPSLPPATEFVVNPAPGSEAAKFMARSLPPTFTSQVTQDSSNWARPDQMELPLAADAAAVFGQSAAPLPLPVLSTAGVAPSPTAPAAPPASGLAPLASPAPALQIVASAGVPAAPAPQARPADGVEVDTDGLPWDERIHAGTKRKNADGRWAAKRGINDPDLVPRVVAKLRAQMAAGGVTTQSADPLPPSIPAPSTAPLAALPATSSLASLAAPTQPAIHVSPPLAAPTQSLGGAPTPTTFADFMTAATIEVQTGSLTALQFGEACKPYGGPAGLASNPAAIPTVWAALKAKCQGML